MIRETALQRVDELITRGNEVLATRRPAGRGVIGPDRVDAECFYQWMTSSLHFLRNYLGEDAIHTAHFQEHCRRATHGNAQSGVAVLKAAKEDVEGGYFQRVQSLAYAEVFNDFVDQAQHLMEQGYKGPAASLAGATLEDRLRKLAIAHNIPVQNSDDISALNNKLADRRLYSRLRQQQIQTQKRVRDLADHGCFDEFSSQDVEALILFVRQFLSEHF